MKIRLGQQGWKGSTPAETLDEVFVGLKLLWVELDGHKFEDVISAEFRADVDDIGQIGLVVKPIGSFEVVYVGQDGEELGSTRVLTNDAPGLGKFEYDTFIERPPDALRDYLDHAIRTWRADTEHPAEMRSHYIDAFQSVRVSMFDELLPLDEPEEQG